ncbi:MAG: hypothetical protein GY757_12585 [bacterium]|nr:hypothetical protein [bacterium]
MLLFLIPWSGCIKLKHEMTINPIHVTVEIKVKIDRELDDFFGDIDKAAAEDAQKEKTGK